MSSASPTPRIARYHRDCSAALSFTFDDGYRHQVENACEIIEPLGIRGTFFLIPEHMEGGNRKENVITWEEAGRLMARGHELGTHGSIRRKLHEVDSQTLDEQVNGGWRRIGERTGGYPRSYAAPGGSRLDDHVYAKVIENHLFVRSQKYLPAARVLGYGNTDKRQWDDQQTRETIRLAMREGNWVLPVVHAIVDGWAPFRSKDEFRIHCEWLQSQKERLWLAPMGTVGRYVRLREASRVAIHDTGRTHCSFSLISPLPAEGEQDRPLTVVLPVSAAEVKASDAEGRELSARVRPEKVLVEVPVNTGPVQVEWH